MDGLDPFAAFTTEVKSALPDGGKTDSTGAADGASADPSATIFNLAPKEAPVKKEVMRAPSVTPATATAPAMAGYPAAAPPQAMNGYGAPPQAADPWGQPAPQSQAPPAAVPPPAAAPAGAMVPSATPSADPYGLAAYGAPAAAAPAPIVPAPAAPQPVAYSPFDQPAAAPPAAPVAAPPAPAAEPAAPYSAPAPTTETIASAYNSDPFGVFGGAAPAPAQPAPAPAPVAADPWGPSPAAPAPPESAPPAPVAPVPAGGDDDFFGAFFANAAPAAAAPAPAPVPAADAAPAVSPRGQPMPEAKGAPVTTTVTSADLPPGGKQYTVEISENSLGVVFFEATSLRKTIYHEGETDVDDLGERPVVAFMTKDSAARKAHIKVGHVLLNVNGTDVKTPREANKAIKATKERPFHLTLFIPDFPIMFFEGMHMVKYDERTGLAPLRAADWKPKYVVIGGVIGYHWQMKMYRNHKEYDTAVMETFNHVPVSVKVKDFGIHHTCRLNQPEVRKITYKTSYDGSETWYYIAMKSPLNNCIKISSKNTEDLKNMTDGIKAVLRTYHTLGTDYELNQAEGRY